MKSLFSALMLVLFVMALGAQSVTEIQAEIEAAKQELIEKEAMFEQKMMELKNTDPSFAPQSPFESDPKYLMRLAQTSPTIVDLRNQYFGDIWQRLARLRSQTFTSENVSLAFGKYDANAEIWDVSIKNNEYHAEIIEFKLPIPRALAKLVFKDQSRLKIEGFLAVNLGDRIGLVGVRVRDTLSDYEFKTNFPLALDTKYDRLTFSPDGRMMAASYRDSTAVINATSLGEEFKIENGRLSMGYHNSRNTLTFSPDSKYLITGGYYSDCVHVYNIQDRKLAKSFDLCGVQCSPDARLLAVRKGWDLELYTAESFKHIIDYDTYSREPVDFNHDGSAFAFIEEKPSYDTSDFVVIFDQATQKERLSYYPPYRFYSLTFDPIGKYFILVGRDGRVHVVGIRDTKEKNVITHFDSTEEEGMRIRVACSPNGQYLATSSNGFTQIANLTTGKMHISYDVEGEICFSPDGCYLAIGGDVYRTFIEY